MSKTFILSFLLLPVMLSAQVSKITINPGTSGSVPSLLTSFNNNLIMFANDGSHGSELWKHNGTAASIIKDINPGTANGYTGFIWPGMGTLNNVLYFKADDGSGNKLWKYDGVSASVASTTAVQPDAAFYAELNGKLYFTGDELYVYDPTNNIIQVAADINQTSAPSYTNSLFAWQNKLYFSATTASKGVELIVYDPVTNLASLVEDINPGSGDSYPARFVAVNNKLYFTAKTASYGNELYSYDGINTPQRLTDINPGTGDGIPSILTRMCIFNNAIYFSGTTGSALYDLYKYDYINNYVTIAPGIPAGHFYNPDFFVVYANKLFFNGRKGSTDYIIFSYDGINAPHAITNTDLQYAFSLTTANNHLYFTAIPFTSTDDELYMYYDSSLTITSVSSISNVYFYPNPVKNNAYFDITLNQSATLGISITNMQGREVYHSDMTEFNASRHIVALPIENLSAGFYTYSIRDEAGKLSASGKLIKE